MGRCDDCMKNPVHTDKKCCFNCARSGTDCEVWHNCGEDCPGWKSKVVTNADKIRAMTDEELAYWIMCPYDSPYCTGTDQCIECTLEWLKQPVVEVDDAENR